MFKGLQDLRVEDSLASGHRSVETETQSFFLFSILMKENITFLYNLLMLK